jgi:hypothetical protein
MTAVDVSWIEEVGTAVLREPPFALFEWLARAASSIDAARQYADAAGVPRQHVEWRTASTAWRDILELAAQGDKMKPLLRAIASKGGNLAKELKEILLPVELEAAGGAAMPPYRVLKERAELDRFARQRAIVVFHVSESDRADLEAVAKWKWAQGDALARVQLLAASDWPEREAAVVVYRDGFIVERVTLADQGS